MKVLCYHGSPGLPEEFQALAKFQHQRNIIPVVRDGYPATGPDRLPQRGSFNKCVRPRDPIPNNCILLGYSWGCVDAISDAARRPECVRGLLLVSPYVFPTSSLGRAAQLLISTPLVGALLLRMKSRNLIEEMLLKTSRPRQVPDAYRAVSDRLAAASVLKVAALEKQRREPISVALGTVAERHIPVGLVYGAHDDTSRSEEQFDELRKAMRLVVETCLPDAGHAIPWTHAKELSDALDQFVELCKEQEK